MKQACIVWVPEGAGLRLAGLPALQTAEARGYQWLPRSRDTRSCLPHLPRHTPEPHYNSGS